MPEEPADRDRRRPRVPSLHQPTGPATMCAAIGGREVIQLGDVVELTDRTVVVEVPDPTVALAFSLAAEVTVVVEVGGTQRRFEAVPGRRASDNPTSRRVELVIVDVI